MAKKKKTSDDRRKKIQELVEERNQDANSFFSGNENVTRENIGQKSKEDSNNFKKESAKRKNISSSSNQSNNYTYSSRNNDYELPMINNNENRFQLPTVNRPQMPTMNFQSRARRNSSFTGINLNENSLKDKQKETSRKVFEALNPGKQLSYSNKNEQPNLPNKSDLIRNILTTGASISKGENAGKLVNNILTTTQNLGTSAYTGLLQFGKTLNERLADRQNLSIKTTQSLADMTSDKDKAKALLKGQAELYGTNYDENNNTIEEKKYEDINKDIQSKIDEENRNTAKRIEESTGLGKTTAELASSLGNNLVGMVGSAINPGLGLTYFVGSSTGSYEDDARERGMTGDKAKLYSGIMGAFEGVGDYIFGYGALNKGLSAVGKESVGKAITKFGESLLGSGLENAFQEGITEPIQELVATITNGKDKADWKNIGQRIFKSFVFGFASGTIFHGIGRGLGSISNIKNKINNGEMLSSTDLQNVTQELEASGMSKKEIFENAKNNALEAVNSEAQRIMQEEQQKELTNFNNQEQAKQDITEKINNSNLSEEDKSNMLDYVQNENFTQSDYNAMMDKVEESNDAVEENQNNYFREDNNQNGIKKYNKDDIKRFTTNKMNLIDGYNSNLYDFINEHYDEKTKMAKKHPPRNSEQKMFLGRINNKTSSKLNELINNSHRFKNIYNLNDYNIVLSENNIEHSFNRHGNEIEEGQIDVTPEVMAKYGEVINNPDFIGLSDSLPTVREPNPKLYFAKKINGYSVALEVISSKKQLFPKAYYAYDSNSPKWNDFIKNKKLKEVETVDSDKFKNSPEMNVQDGTAVTSIVNNSIPQSTGNVKGETIINNNSMQNTENNTQETEINPYRNTGRANKLIKEKNNKIEQLENNLKQALTQEEQNNIQQEIQNTEKLYTDKIQSLYDEINNKDNKESKAPTRHEVIQKNREIARQNIENIANWKDKSRGLSYQLETMERNMYDIIPDKAEAKRMNDTYFEPIHTAEADKQKFINKYNDRIKNFNLNKHEAEAVQVLGEQKYNPSFDAKEAEKALDNVKKNIEKGKIDQEKVDNAIEEFRSIYDELFDLENKVLRDNGYKEKDYRKGYFPHFIDYTPETTSEKILNKLGFKIDKRPLPTDIAGITEQFVPGKTWNRSALQRKTNKTDYNVLKGFDTYIAQASDNIFHTENIQRLRGLENEIRYQYSDKGVQKRIDEILNNDVLDADEKQDMIDAILKQVENPMPNLVTELRRYTNALANKKSEADRSMEQMAGRQVYSTINAIENKFGANAVGLNIGSAVTNFIPITQAWSQIGTKNIARASIDYSKSLIEDDGFVNKSAFLTSRLNQAEKLYQTWSDKATSKANFLFDAIDDVASNIVVRGKYLENIQKGMSETEAIKNADQFARNVIADRSKGALPTKFEEKNPISKAFTQFQLEVNNQYRYMFKDIPRDLKEKGLGAIAIAYLKMFVGAWLYNKFAEKITGRKPAFSPIDLIKSSYDTIKDEKMGTYEKITKIGKDIGEQAPFIGGFLGGGRIPINGALPNIANVTKAGIGLTTGEMDSKKAKETLGKEFSKPLYYLLPPLGGGQLKKSVEGISAVNNGGSYGIDKDGKETLQFPVENKNALNYIKAGVFGKYALPEAKTYTDSGFKGLNAKQTEAYKEIKMPYKEFIDYTNNKLEKTSDKINYINNMKISDDQKWGLYKYDVLSSTQRDDGTSQKSDAEYAINNKLTTKKEYMDLYNKANNNNINMPNTEELKNIKEQGISLKTFVDYKINSKGNKKQSDKIKMLLDSNYSDEEKGSLYINYINKNDNQYETMKATGIDIDEYIKYKQQNFKSDTTDNGTLKGKSERNKKNKVVKYLNSMNIKGNQRLLLYAMERYKTTPSQKNQLVKYVNSLDLKNKEKLELFNKFSGFKVYKNGKITY